jgi:MerR family redox-sensitive transcriptional activator SoxR
MDKTIAIGELAKRSGMATSAIRFYEQEGLIDSTRTTSGRRQYRKETLRRVAFIRAAQAVGLSLMDIKKALAQLPGQRTPTRQDWERLSRTWQPLLQEHIDRLTALRDKLTGCIGCGCLSLKSCALYNPEDIAQSRGSGARYLLGNSPSDVLIGSDAPGSKGRRAVKR